MELDELVEHWTLLVDEQELIAGKRGSTRLGFALLLKFYVRLGRFPRGRSELPDEAVVFVAKQVGVPPGELGFYEWAGSTIGYHRWQIRAYLGFRECSVQDSDTLTGWLAVNVCETERRHDQVREELLMRCRGERIEPPAAKRVDRIVRSALHQAEQTLTRRIVQAIPADVVERLHALVAVDGMEDDDLVADSIFGLIKSVPGNVSLDSMLTETRKLRAVREVGLPAGLFAGVAPKVVAGWRARAAVESGSHLREHPDTVKLTLLAALLHSRQREITDALVELLISTVHRIGARADKRVVQELVNAFKRVTGKENILFAIAEACVGAPDEPVRAVVFPAVTGGEQTLRELVHEYKTKGPVYRRTVQTTLKASYSNPLPARPDRPARRVGVPFEQRHPPAGARRPGVDHTARRRAPDLLPRCGGGADAQGAAGSLDTAGVPGHQPGPPPGHPHGLRDLHVPGVAGTVAVQGNLGGRRRQVAQPRRRPARRLRRPPGRALRGAAQTDRCERVHRPAPTRNAHRTGRPA